MVQLPDFLAEYLNFLDKLGTLGFFGSMQPDDLEENLDQYLPNLLIASYGMVFQAITSRLEQAIAHMDSLAPWQQERLFQKCLRGSVVSPAEGYDIHLLSPDTLYPETLALHVAGPKSMALMRTRDVLNQHGIQGDLNINGLMGVLEEELHLVIRHMAHRVLPALNRQGIHVSSTSQTLIPMMAELGKTLGASPNAFKQTDTQPSTLDETQITLSMADLAMARQVRELASSSQQDDALLVLDDIINGIQQALP
jgi:hypothetical protein